MYSIYINKTFKKIFKLLTMEKAGCPFQHPHAMFPSLSPSNVK